MTYASSLSLAAALRHLFAATQCTRAGSVTTFATGGLSIARGVPATAAQILGTSGIAVELAGSGGPANPSHALQRLRRRRILEQ